MTLIVPKNIECAGCGHELEAWTILSRNSWTQMPDLRPATCPHCGRAAEGFVVFADEPEQLRLPVGA